MARKPNIASAEAEAKIQSSSFSSFPIDPFHIAASNDIEVVAGDPGKPGISGCIIFSNESACIYYSRNIRSLGFQRFTVAHELGHYFIPGHPEEIMGAGGTHFSKGEFEDLSPIEREADQFAAHLLMPRGLSLNILQQQERGLAGIRVLSDEAITSITAAAIRAVQLNPYPVAIIKSKDDVVQFSLLSQKLREFGFMRPYQRGSALPDMPEDDYGYLGDWFDTAPSKLEVRGQTVSLGTYGRLTVITPISDLVDPYEEEDEERKLEESWEVRFRRR